MQPGGARRTLLGVGNMTRDVVTPGDPHWPWVGVGVATLVTGLATWGFFQGQLSALRLVLAIAITLAFWTDVVTFLPRLIFLPAMILAAIGMGGQGNSVSIFIVVVCCGAAATTGTLVEALVTLAVALGAVAVRAATSRYGLVDFIIWPVGFASAFASGLTIRTLLNLNARLRASQATVSAQAATEERRRLAREVHDVIAHSLTVTMLHITAARLALGDDPPDVAEALGGLAEAEVQGRRSLTDIRRTVGLLDAAQPPPEESPLAAPIPGAVDLVDLVASYRAAGVPVSLRAEGDVSSLSPATGLAAYRIVQESLANAAKHAPGARVDVHVHVGRRRMEIRVVNGPPVDGCSPLVAAGLPDGGRGAAGMADRARLLGGRVEMGRRGDGWRVCALLPVAALDPAMPA